MSAESTRPSLREVVEAAECVSQFDVIVHGATAPDGEAAVILGLLPPDARGWTFPLPPVEARRIGALLIEVANEKEPPNTPFTPVPSRSRPTP